MNKWAWFQWMVLVPVFFGASLYISACGGPVEASSTPADVVVFGDDFVAGGSCLSNTEIEWRGYYNATTIRLLQRVPLNTAPSRVYVMAGSVDFVDNNSNVYAVLSGYQRLVEALATPETEVVAISILYAARKLNIISVNGDELNAKIKSFNSQLKTMCAGGACRYMDVNAVMSYGGYLEEGYATPNGLDLSTAGYATFGSLITRDVNGSN